MKAGNDESHVKQAYLIALHGGNPQNSFSTFKPTKQFQKCRKYLQTIMALALTGEVPDRRVDIWRGDGANGICNKDMLFKISPFTVPLGNQILSTLSSSSVSKCDLCHIVTPSPTPTPVPSGTSRVLLTSSK